MLQNIVSSLSSDDCCEKIEEYIKSNPYKCLQAALCVSGAVGLGIYSAVQMYRNRVKPNTMLELDLNSITLTDKFHHQDNDNLMSLLSNSRTYQYSIHEFCRLLDLIDKDTRIEGIIVKLDTCTSKVNLGGVVRIEQLRRAFCKFSKKKVFYIKTDFSCSYSLYYLASCFDHVIAHPYVHMILNGLLLSMPFVKKMLDKLEIKMEVYKREESKRGGDMFLYEKIDDLHKQEMFKLINSIDGNWKKEILVSRKKLDEVSLNKVFKKGLIDHISALNKNVIDHVCYMDELNNYIEKNVLSLGKEKMNLLFFNKYLERRKKDLNIYKGKNKVAIIYMKGNIVDGRSDSIKKTIFSETFADMINEIVDRDKHKVMIFRINSGGGSVLGSEKIRRAIVRAKKKGIWVIVSMGRVAGSGAYWISCSCNKIFAERMTITGSIGVLSMRMELQSFFMNKLGINVETIGTEESSTMISNFNSLNDDQKKHFNEFHDRIYSDFLNLVSKERNIPMDDVKEIAKGKIYFGEEALKLKLVDQIGGLEEAIDEATKYLNLKLKSELKIDVYPKKNVLNAILNELSPPQNSQDRRKRSATVSAGNYFNLPDMTLLSQVSSLVTKISENVSVFGGNQSGIQSRNDDLRI